MRWSYSSRKRTVTFRYKHRKTRQWRIIAVSGHEFMRRFLQHVLPKGFHKVRYYGLWYCAHRAQAQNARITLLLTRPQAAPADAPVPSALDAELDVPMGGWRFLPGIVPSVYRHRESTYSDGGENGHDGVSTFICGNDLCGR